MRPRLLWFSGVGASGGPPLTCLGLVALCGVTVGFAADPSFGLGLIRDTPESRGRGANLGVPNPAAPIPGQPRAPMLTTATLPSAVDNSTSPYFPPIGSQGGQGSCSAWSTTYYCQGFLQRKDKGWTDSANTHRFSPAYTYNQLRTADVNGGSSVSDCLSFLTRFGACSWADLPYSDTNDTAMPTEAAYRAAAEFRTLGWGSFVTIDDANLTLLRQHLASGNLAVTTMFVYPTWVFKDAAGTSYSYSRGNISHEQDRVMTGQSGSYEGGHALTVVGYDDNKRYGTGLSDVGAFKIANSWGSGWGIGGFFWVSYAYFKTYGNETSHQWEYDGGGDHNDTYVMWDRVGYTPKAYATVEFNHNKREQLRWAIGIKDGSTEVYRYYYFGNSDPSFDEGTGAGEKYPYIFFFPGSSVPSPRYVVDVSELLYFTKDNASSTWVLLVGDACSANTTGTVSYFKVECGATSNETSPGTTISETMTDGNDLRTQVTLDLTINRDDPRILLVDGDISNTGGWYPNTWAANFYCYNPGFETEVLHSMAALASRNSAYAFQAVNRIAPQSLPTLTPYTCVFYLTGRYASYANPTLNAIDGLGDRSSLETYLTNFGRLFLTGESTCPAMMTDGNGSNNAFVTDKLKVGTTAWMDTSSVPQWQYINGVAGDPISDNIKLTYDKGIYGSSASCQRVNQAQAGAGAVSIFQRQADSNWCGVRYDSGTWMTVHLPFELLGVADVKDRHTVIQRSLDWLLQVCEFTWNNTGTTDWNTDVRWDKTKGPDGPTTPDSDDLVIFPSAASITQPNVPAGGSGAKAVSINNGGGAYYNINGSGNTLTVALGGFRVTGAGTNTTTVQPHIALATDQTWYIDTGNTLALSGNLSGSYMLTKTGAGTLTLGGSSSTYSGTTTVSAGKLLVNGTLASGGDVSVLTSATLGGTGTIGRNVNLDWGSTLSPGASPGVLATNTLTFQSGSQGVFELGMANSDRVNVTGNLTFAPNVTLTLSDAGDMRDNQYYLVFEYTGTLTGRASVTLVNNTGFTLYTGVASNGLEQYTHTDAKTYLRVGFGANPTPVRVAEFVAEGAGGGGGALLEWTCGSEQENAGFHVWRRLAGEGEEAWTRRTATLIPGGLTTGATTEYAWYDPCEAGAYEYRLESVSTRGAGEFYGKLAEVTVEGGGGIAAPDEKASEVVRAAYGEYRQRGARAARQEKLQRAAAGAGWRVGQVTALARKPARVGWCGGGSPRSVLATTPVWSGVSELLVGVKAAQGLAASAELAVQAMPPLQGESGVLALAGADVSGRGGSVAPLAGDGSAPLAAATPAPLARASGVGTPPAPAYSGALARPGPVAKVVYRGSGLLRVPDSSLPPSFDASRVTAEREGEAVSVLARTADGLLLYGPGYEDEYTDEDVYFLRPTRRATGVGAAPYGRAGRNRGATAERVTEATTTVRFHEVYYDWYTWRVGYYYDYEPWFSRQYLTSGSTATYTVECPGATSGGGRVAVDLWSFSDLPTVAPDHRLAALVNGQAVGEVSWDGGRQGLTVSFDIPAGVLKDGANTVELYTVPLAGNGWQLGLVYSVSVTYERKLKGAGPLEVAAKEGAAWEEASGFATKEVYVVDRTEASAAKLVEYEWYAEQDGTYTVRFVRRPGREYLIVPRGSEKQPLSVTLRYIEPLNGGAGYLAVGAGRFENALKPLLEQRTKEGLRAAFAEQERVFDAYGWGRYGPEGIRRAVRVVRPRYLLLVGSTKYDYRNYEGKTTDRGCPTFLAQTSMFSQAPGDPLFGDFGRGYPEVAVGRYPAKDESELGTAVGRALSYTGRRNESGPWGLMVADKPDPSAGDFVGEADGVVGQAVQWEWEKAYQGVEGKTAAEVRAQIVAAAASGDVIGYVGHGSAAALGKDGLVKTGTVGQWTGNVVLVMATCNGNYFLMDVPTLARGLLFQVGGGVAATIGPTTYVQSGPTTEVMGVLMGSARSGGRWGEAVLAGQQEAYGRSQGRAGLYDDLLKAETLLGDPALPVEQAAPQAAPASAQPPKTDAGTF